MMDPKVKYLNKDMCRMILKIRLLYRISHKSTYSYALIEEFSHGPVSHLMGKSGKGLKNDVYNTLTSLEKSGFIVSKAKIEGGKLKNYYHVTSVGKGAIKESKRLMADSFKEIAKIVK